MTGRERIETLLNNQEPDRIVYSPNIWQWFNHHKNKGSLPDPLKKCKTLVEAHQALGEDCFSRNLATDQRNQWYGGFSDVHFTGEIKWNIRKDKNHVIHEYSTPFGLLSEEFLYDDGNSTLVQNKYLITDPARELKAFKILVQSRNQIFNAEKWQSFEEKIRPIGMNICGDWCCPLKLLHFAANPENTVYMLTDYESLCREIMEIHTCKILESITTALRQGVRVIMSMDNLDSFFYPPHYFRSYCRDFYSKVADICHRYNARFMIHACGRIKDLLIPCVECGVDGLEGVTPPPLGDVSLAEARSITGNRFICNGGITAPVQENIKTKQDCYDYTRSVFEGMPDRRDFVFSMSCNTSIHTSYDVIRWFGDASRELSSMHFQGSGK